LLHFAKRKIRLSLYSPFIKSCVQQGEIQNIRSPHNIDALSSSYHQCERGVWRERKVKSYIKKWFLIATEIITAEWRKIFHRHFSRITKCGKILHFDSLPWFGFVFSILV